MKNDSRKKNMNYLKYEALTIALSLAIAGCAGNNNSTTSSVSSAFKMTGSSSNATVAKSEKPKSIWDLILNKAYALVPSSIVDSTGAAVTLTEAWTVIKEIEFKSGETAGAEDSESEVEFRGPYFVDLLSSAPVVLDTQLMTAKSIKRIKMKLESTQTVLPTGAPAGLANNSIYFAGAVASKNFKFQLNDGTELEIAGPNSFQPGANSEILVEIQVANIFKQIDLSGISPNEVIDHSNRHSGSNLCPSIDVSASDLYTCLRNGLGKHADFGDDLNGDNTLDSHDSHVK